MVHRKAQLWALALAGVVGLPGALAQDRDPGGRDRGDRGARGNRGDRGDRGGRGRRGGFGRRGSTTVDVDRLFADMRNELNLDFRQQQDVKQITDAYRADAENARNASRERFRSEDFRERMRAARENGEDVRAIFEEMRRGGPDTGAMRNDLFQALNEVLRFEQQQQFRALQERYTQDGRGGPRPVQLGRLGPEELQRAVQSARMPDWKMQGLQQVIAAYEAGIQRWLEGLSPEEAEAIQRAAASRSRGRGGFGGGRGGFGGRRGGDRGGERPQPQPQPLQPRGF